MSKRQADIFMHKSERTVVVCFWPDEPPKQVFVRFAILCAMQVYDKSLWKRLRGENDVFAPFKWWKRWARAYLDGTDTSDGAAHDVVFRLVRGKYSAQFPPAIEEILWAVYGQRQYLDDNNVKDVVLLAMKDIMDCARKNFRTLDLEGAAKRALTAEKEGAPK